MAAAKNGKAGLNSLGVSFLTALPVFLNESVPKSKNLSTGFFNSLGINLIDEDFDKILTKHFKEYTTKESCQQQV